MTRQIIIPTTDPSLEVVICEGENTYESVALRNRQSGELSPIQIDKGLKPWFHQVFPDGSVSIVCFDEHDRVWQDWNFKVDLGSRSLVREGTV